PALPAERLEEWIIERLLDDTVAWLPFDGAQQLPARCAWLEVVADGAGVLNEGHRAATRAHTLSEARRSKPCCMSITSSTSTGVSIVQVVARRNGRCGRRYTPGVLGACPNRSSTVAPVRGSTLTPNRRSSAERRNTTVGHMPVSSCRMSSLPFLTTRPD